jgi:hypothetical protein
MTAILTIVQDTWFTLSQSQSTDLPDDQKHHVAARSRFSLSNYEMEEDYYKITLDGDQIDGHSTWFVSISDVEIEGVQMRVASFFPPIPGIGFLKKLFGLAPAVGHETTIEPKRP